MKYIFIALALPILIAGAVIGTLFWLLAFGFRLAGDLIDDVISAL